MEGTLGEIRMYAGSAAPSGWHFCDGASLSIASFSALYAVLGTTFGGTSGNFNLPNFENRTALGVGTGTSLGQTGGGTATLGVNNLPAHNHTITGNVTPQASADGTLVTDPTGKHWGPGSFYSAPAELVAMAPIAATGLSSSNTGSGAAFDVMPPYLGIQYIICIFAS